MEEHTAFAMETIKRPNAVIANEVMHLNTSVGKVGQLAEEARVAFRYYVAPFVPEVEHVA